jgi:hypothetical protein
MRIYFYKSKIPWWEWIEDIVDPWVPTQAQRLQPSANTLNALAALGLAPRAETLLTAGLGVATVVAAHARRTSMGENPEAVAQRLDTAWTVALHPLVETFRGQLKAAVQVARQFERTLGSSQV